MNLRDLTGAEAAIAPIPNLAIDARRTPRRQVRGAGIVAWVEEDGRSQCCQVQFEDVSELGAGLFLPTAVPVGCTIWLLVKRGADFRAVTRYCREWKGGFRVGIRTIPEKRSVRGSQGIYKMKWFDAWDNLRTSGVSLERDKNNKLTVVADQKVPCPSIVLLATDEDQCLAYCRSCGDRAPYRLTVEILSDTYVSYQGTRQSPDSEE